MTGKTKTRRMGGRTRRLEEPRGTGAWVLLAVALLAAAGAVLLARPDARSAEAPPALDVWLVRHAEKVADSGDPALSERGEARADLLADKLAEAGIDRIHSTDYRRTRSTAAPLAKVLGLEVERYDPTELEAFAAELHAAGGTHLVVGHSNTTPALVEALGGDPVSPMAEDEYDRVYRVWVDDEGTTRSELTRFGERFGG